MVLDLTDMVAAGGKRIAASVAQDAGRLECLVFNGYDPHSKGDEPRGFRPCWSAIVPSGT